MSNALVLLAGGASQRMGSQFTDKPLLMLNGKQLIIYSLEAFIKSEVVDTVIIVYKNEMQRRSIMDCIKDLSLPSIQWALGGTTRQASALHGLRALETPTEYVFIHDSARPLIHPESIRRLHQTVLKDAAAGLAHKVTDTIVQKNADEGIKPLKRESLWAMETPQVFKHSLILEAYEAMESRQEVATDESGAVTKFGHPVTLVENLWPNPKMTTPEDLLYIEYLLNKSNSRDVTV